jgi:cell division protein ZapA (FtsZ GTPase activity inhibitor)
MLISVRDSHLGSLDEIAKAAERAGMDVDAKMKEIGVVSGLIEADRIDALRAIDGVADVEEDKKFSLPPGNS